MAEVTTKKEKSEATKRYERETRIKRIQERLRELKEYKRILAEDGLVADVDDKKLESELIVQLLRLEKGLPPKAKPKERKSRRERLREKEDSAPVSDALDTDLAGGRGRGRNRNRPISGQRASASSDKESITKGDSPRADKPRAAPQGRGQKPGGDKPGSAPTRDRESKTGKPRTASQGRDQGPRSGKPRSAPQGRGQAPRSDKPRGRGKEQPAKPPGRSSSPARPGIKKKRAQEQKK